MRNSRFLIVLGLSLGFAQYAHAVCDGSTNCELPASNSSAGSWTASASGITGIQSLNSVGPSGNNAGSRYYFAAVTSSLGSTTAKGTISTTGDGTQVIGSFALNSGSTPGSLVTGGVVQPLLGAQTYFVYAQACPSGALLDSARCSNWALLGSKATLAYPTSVFLTPVRPADATQDSIFARASVPTADVFTISQLQFEINNLITGGLNQTGILLAWAGNTSYEIDSSLYTAGGGFRPNVKYLYRGQVFYPYGVAVPTGGAQTQTNFWTTPVQPGTVTTSNITHCSVQITAQNSTGSPSNPSYTDYNLCAVGTSGSCSEDDISGANPTDTASAVITGLLPGTNYTPQATALVGNDDGTSSGWNNSPVRSGTGFTTLAWGGDFDISNVGTTSADAVISGVNTAGIQSWEIRLNGNAAASGNAGNLNGTHNLTGLTPNTAYTATIVLTEGSGCSSTLNFTPNSFTTTPNAPTNPSSFSNVLATSLRVNWTDSTVPANPNGSTFEVNLCLDAGFSSGCQTTTVNKPTLFANFNVNPVTTYFARVRTRNINRPTWPDSAYLTVGSTTTPPNQSSISISPNPGNAVTGNPAVFTATVFDQSGSVVPGQAVNWSYSGGNSQISPLNGVSTTLTANAPGSFTLTASLAGYPNATAPVTVVAAGPFFVNPPALTVNPNNLTGTLTTLGNDNVDGEASLTYTWSLESGPASVSVSPNGTNAAKNAVVTFSQAGNYVLRCTIQNQNGSAFATTNPGNVAQVLASIGVTPNNVTISVIDNQTFTATGLDQFGQAMNLSAVNWSSTGGSVSGAGVFQSGTLGNNIRVTATSGAISGSANVNVVNYDVSGAIAYPVPFKSTQGSTIHFRGLGSSAKIRIYTVTGRQVFNVEVSQDTYDWNVKNNSGESIASGVYLYVIESPSTTKNGKLIIIQ
jgi:hypothetical protein